MNLLITGASRGIGAALVTLAAEQGHRVLAVGRNKTVLEEKWQSHQQVQCDELDVSSNASWQALIERTEGRGFSIDVLINVAGVLASGQTGELKEADIHAMLDVNVKGCIFGTNACARVMKTRKRGHIINIGSTASLFATPGTTIYATSKYALRGFCIAARGDLAEHGIAVSLVGPAAVKTDMLEVQRGDSNAALTFTGKRALTPEEVAQAVLGPVLRHRPLEYYLPKSDGWLGKFSTVCPRIFLWLARRARAQGMKNFRSARF